MKTLTFLCLGAVALFSVGSFGCGSNTGPGPNPPAAAVPAPTPIPARDGDLVPSWHVSGPTDDAKIAQVAGISFPKPPTWTWQPTSMRFRTLQYQVPGKVSGSGAAELVFSVFAGQDGGPTAMNIDRWKSQFRTADGEPAEAVETSWEGDGLRVTTVSAAGFYKSMGAAAPRMGQAHRSAIVEADGRRVFVRMVGPQGTVDAAALAFEELLRNASVDG